MRRPHRVALVVTVACAVGLAGCGGSSGGGSAAPVTVDPALTKLGPDHGWSQTNVTADAASLKCNTAASDPNRGITATSIKIGGLVSVTSPAGAAMGDTTAGAAARFGRANADGGVNGRKIDFLDVRDDGSDAARDADQAKAIVEKDKPFASIVATTNGNYLDSFCSGDMPFFGWGNNTGFCGNVIGFGITGCQTPATGSQRAVDTTGGLLVGKSVPAGAAKTLALIGLDNDAARQGLVTVRQSFDIAGFKTVYNKSPIPVSGLTDPTSIVSEVMTADAGKPPAVVFFISQFNDAIKLTGALKAAGYKGTIVSPIYDPRVSGLKEFDDTYALLQWQGGFNTDIPAVAQMVADFKKYSPDAALSLTAVAGYWAADMLVTGLQKAGKDLTVDSFLKTLNTDYSNYVPGALPETRWPVNHVAPAPCETVAHLTNGTWSAGPLQCGAVTRTN
ncbi:ABC transporter substrate-binding protein [Pseudofrankia inefficax]|uniref:ABC-type branched-chain amino acid transport systems periplasmic component-like protein n=1 Tax=Pseudofrankia inefficax (strain DSM 45817 / CECT 9037 / DDB 130130 / EuI1c) TaxID=298654 RepID=E3JAJ4_PSEI1|nr:ABC transporter substrate-binding protein [Pseudofrankia inefficax]ADP82186.1 ABC-type branched-chain amino acid transport systems periplasmic component-like protein [Pseudofrankia inefficax]